MLSSQGGWDHITVRGNAMEAPRIQMPSLTDNSSQQTSGRGPVQTRNQPEMNGNPVGCQSATPSISY